MFEKKGVAWEKNIFFLNRVQKYLSNYSTAKSSLDLTDIIVAIIRRHRPKITTQVASAQHSDWLETTRACCECLPRKPMRNRLNLLRNQKWFKTHQISRWNYTILSHTWNDAQLGALYMCFDNIFIVVTCFCWKILHFRCFVTWLALPLQMTCAVDAEATWRIAHAWLGADDRWWAARDDRRSSRRLLHEPSRTRTCDSHARHPSILRGEEKLPYRNVMAWIWIMHKQQAYTEHMYFNTSEQVEQQLNIPGTC